MPGLFLLAFTALVPCGSPFTPACWQLRTCGAGLPAIFSRSFSLVTFAFALPVTGLVLSFRIALGLMVLVPTLFDPFDGAADCSSGFNEAVHASCFVRDLIVFAAFLIAVGLVRLALLVPE